MKMIEDVGKYKNDTDVIEFKYSFPSYDSLEDAVEALTETSVLSLVNRQAKVDAGNTARSRAQAKNGHSKVTVMSPEAKAKAKADRAKRNAMIAMLASKGIDSLEDLEASL